MAIRSLWLSGGSEAAPSVLVPALLVLAELFLLTLPFSGCSHPQGTPADWLRNTLSAGHRLAAEVRGVEAVSRLLKQGLDVNALDAIGWTAFMQAGLEGLPDVTDPLLRSGADVNARSDRGDTALIVAAACSIVRARAGADVSAARKDGCTALMRAAMLGWPEIVRLLLAAKADVSACDELQRLAADGV